MSLRDLLELIYFASAPLLVFIALFGLRQLTLTKRIFRTTSQINAFKLATEQTDVFINRIMKLHLDLRIKLANNEFIKAMRSNIKISGQIIDIKYPTDRTPIDTLLANGAEIIDLINTLDSFSIPFNVGIASEEIAFSSIGKIYCEYIEELLPFLLGSANRVDLSQDHECKHMLQLYSLWKQRLEKAKLTQEKKKLEEQLSSFTTSPKKALGTE